MKHRTDRDLWPRRGVKAQRVEFSERGAPSIVSREGAVVTQDPARAHLYLAVKASFYRQTTSTPRHPAHGGTRWLRQVAERAPILIGRGYFG